MEEVIRVIDLRMIVTIKMTRAAALEESIQNVKYASMTMMIEGIINIL